MSKKAKDSSAKEVRRQRAAAECERLEKVRKKNVIILTASLFTLLTGLVDTQAVYSYGAIPLNPFAFYGLTILLTLVLGSVAFASWRVYRDAENALRSLRR